MSKRKEKKFPRLKQIVQPTKRKEKTVAEHRASSSFFFFVSLIYRTTRIDVSVYLSVI
jgi:hypothetical protein